MGTVATTDLATATAFSNQRKIDRTSNGVLWEIYGTSGGLLRAQYSTDGGTTWSSGGIVANASAVNYSVNGSMKFDEDDYFNVAYKDATDGYIKYLRGTPNAARIAYSWSAPVAIRTDASFDVPDIAAFRDPATSGAWRAAVVYSSNSSTQVRITLLSVSAAGAVTSNGETTLSATATNGVMAYPSIDFNHTGDSKTVKDGLPHLYVGWSAGATGAGYGIRFRKATYASGAWTWGTEREIDNAKFVQGPDSWVNCIFDGTRVVLTGLCYGATPGVIVHDRDAADTTTTPRSFPLTSATTPSYGSATYDSIGNLYIIGRRDNPNAVQFMKWTRATASMETPVAIDTTNIANAFCSARRGPQGQAIDYVYTDGTASPYTVTSGRITLNQTPTAPTPLTPADNATWDSSTDQTVTFRHNDPDGDPASAYAAWFRPAGTSVPYQALTGTTTVANGGTITVTVPANTWPGVISYYSTTTDPSGAVSPPSAVRTVTGTPAALAGATGGGGGTAFSALALYSATEVDRVQRAVGRTVKTTVTATSPLTITIDGGPVTATRNAGYTPTVGDLVEASYITDGWVVRDKVVS